MRLESIYIQNVRILEEVSLQSDASFVYLYGENGSGKTSVLEAIHLLATGQSFRSTHQRNLIQYEKPLLRVRGSLSRVNGNEKHNLGIEKGRDGKTLIRHNQVNVKRIADLATLLPLRSVTPDSHALVNGGPVLRRRYLDWGVFHVEQDVFFPWREYNRALSQRNSLLKNSSNNKQMQALDGIFAPLGEAIATARQNYCSRLETTLPEILDSLDSNINLQINHTRGWSKDESLECSLRNKYEHCRRFKTTSVGPHRADLQILANGKPAKEVLSRGQQKIVLYALTLAQVTDYHRNRNTQILMLCDDLQSELDDTRTTSLVETLLSQGHQLFVTGTSQHVNSKAQSKAMFHVKQGLIRKLD